MRRQITTMAMIMAGMLSVLAMVVVPPPADDDNKMKDTISISSQPIIEDEDIPDSLLNPRWKIQRTQPITEEDLTSTALDLKMPENLKHEVEYNDTLDRYIFGQRMTGTYLNAPIMMTTEDYMKWTERQAMKNFFRSKNTEIFEQKGKEKFDFTDMHFDLGPAEKIFGPGGVRIKTQGTAELKLGATIKRIDNPSLPIRNRKTTTMNFDEKINLSVNGKIGDKVNMNLNYNTDATFDYDAQNLKLKYEGKEDEIIKLVEGGNVSFPSNSSLIKGASSLFGIRTDMQFGKLKLQTVISQKKSSNKSVSSKGGKQTTPFEINVTDYEENRHFFLAHYFRDIYDGAMQKLPVPTTGISITRVEIWVTNKTATTTNTRNILAFADIAEGATNVNPSNGANNIYNDLVTRNADARIIDQATQILEGNGYEGGVDFEKLESARLLSSSEYSVNKALGYVSLTSTLQTDQVLAVAYEYTYNGVTYQVGEFASDIKETNKALFVKSLKNASNNPSQSNWPLMMKNVYYLANSVEKDKFRLDVKFQSDTSGVYLTYIPEKQVKDIPIIRLLGADRLDNNNKAHSNGYFDYVDGYTVKNGRVFFPCKEPFGSNLRDYLMAKGVTYENAQKYAFTTLYDSTKTTAKQNAEKNKFQLVGQYRGTNANVISLGAYNVPQGSVVVTAGGQKLTEGVDYSVDYSAGQVTILNQSIIDAGTNINVSLESNTDFGQQRKTMFGINWEYDFTKNFQMSGTLQHLSEQSLTTKVAMGSEPLKNTLWGVNLNWKKESQWLTNMLDKLPGLHLTQPSYITFQGEFAQLIAGMAGGTQDQASYIDDFENTKNLIDVSTPTSWVISSVPTLFSEYKDKTGLTSGYNRSLMSWYVIDPLFTRRSSTLTPPHIKSDLEQLSNHYVREVYVKELYPNRDQSSYNGATATLPILNLAYYPSERGPYNFDTNIDNEGKLLNPTKRWGGMMRKLDTSDFETANIEYIEFWMLDPFIYTGADESYGGDMYINLGDISEDILSDGKKFYESGMPVNGASTFTTTQWGKIPTQPNVTYAFATTSGSRALQDVGYNGLRDEEEKTFETYQNFLNTARAKVTNTAALDSILADPANDNYHYFRGGDYDQRETSILDRYKRINMPQGNSPDNETRTESYDTSYKTTPDVEDINQDYTLNEYDKYFQYKVSVRPNDMYVGHNNIVDMRETTTTLRNGKTETVKWYQFRIPLSEIESKHGNITDFTNIRFMRVFLTNFQKPIIMRFGSFNLVRGEWRVYEQSLNTGAAETGTMVASAVNIEENSDKKPVNYVLPPGIRREQDPTQPQLVEANEQSLSLVVENLSTKESKAVYKNTNLDLRQYKRIEMFVHANQLPGDVTLEDNQLAVFVRLGSDYKNNYYEYEIPLSLTPEGRYDRYSSVDCRAVWPEANMLNVPLSVFTAIKKARNLAKASGTAWYNREFSVYDTNSPKNRISIMGNPTLGEVKTMIIGVRNLSDDLRSGEIWVNELRLKEFNNDGGWAAQGQLNIQMSDFGNVLVTGKMVSEGFGGLEDGVNQRSKDNVSSYSVKTNLELGKFFPDKAKVSIPLYYSISKERSAPKYNPLDNDMLLKEALDAAGSKHARDSIENIAVTKRTNTNFSLSNMKVGITTKGHPMPYDPGNFTFSYSHSHSNTTGETTVYENDDEWRGSINYSYSPVYKPWEPFKKVFAKNKSKWLEILKRFGLNWLPQNISFNTEMYRIYHEQQERDMEDLNTSMPATFSSEFRWNREFSMRWDLTKNLHMSFQSATHAQIEEPYTQVNKDLYPDRYEAWKDSVWTSIKHMGTPLDYNQVFTASYQLPLNLIPIFDWVNSDANYNATYKWTRGTEMENGESLGNIVSNNRQFTINGSFNLEKLYNHFPFLKKANERFNKTPRRVSRTDKAKKKLKDKEKENKKEEKELPKNKKSFEKEITLMPDTTIIVNHGKNSKRLMVSAKGPDGKLFPVKYKYVDQNKIKITTKVDSATTLKLTVTPKPSNEEQSWYKTMQVVARGLMMVRNVSFTYRNQYAMALPGFKPTVGDMFGQQQGNPLAPGLDFAFGFIDDGYIDKALDHKWLMTADDLATPATTNKTVDLQLRMTLEPVKNLKIDLNASRTETKAKSIQYMYAGKPTTQSGSFNMTTISIGTAFESLGDANSGYPSKAFDNFCNSLDGFRDRVEAQYNGSTYPAGSPQAGQKFDPKNGTVSKYSADVMIPAFLSSYTSMSGSSLDIFPTLSKLLPNWTIKYSGLSQLPWFRDVFKSVNLNHSYKSVYAVGSYSSYSTWMEYMNDLGFIKDATTGNSTPSSMYNVSTVSINEAFSPLLGVDFTFNNNLTCKVEYRKIRTLTLSTTSIQINEDRSNDWVFGVGYKITNFNPFASKARKVKNSKKKGDEEENAKKNAQKNNTSGFNSDLNLRLDISLRNQASVCRDIATRISSASNGNKALKLSFAADYTLTKMLTMSFFFNRQTNTPLLSASSYPTTTTDFGLSVKFSLTR